MMNKLISLAGLLFLTGCIGSYISGDTSYLCEDYPDIRKVPERPQACKPRGTHKGDEKKSRCTEFKKLEADREKIKARDQALREE